MPQGGEGHMRKQQSPSGAEGKEGTVGRGFIVVSEMQGEQGEGWLVAVISVSSGAEELFLVC